MGDKPGGVGCGGGGEARHKYEDGMEHEDKSRHEDETCDDTIRGWGTRRSTKARYETRYEGATRRRDARRDTKARYEARYEDRTRGATRRQDTRCDAETGCDAEPK